MDGSLEGSGYEHVGKVCGWVNNALCVTCIGQQRQMTEIEWTCAENTNLLLSDGAQRIANHYTRL